MPLSNREGGSVCRTASQETCQLWYGDDRFQITRFDCTEMLFRLAVGMHLPVEGKFLQSNCVYALDFCFFRPFLFTRRRRPDPVTAGLGSRLSPASERAFFMPVSGRCRRFRQSVKLHFLREEKT